MLRTSVARVAIDLRVARNSVLPAGTLRAMTFRLPAALTAPNDDAAMALLAGYYRPHFGENGSYTGAAFDTWDSTGSRPDDADRFTADDLVAVTLLSVDVDPLAAHALLKARTNEFTALLVAVGPDRDLADESEPLVDDWPGWELQRALRALPGTGPTTASKLFARKRPRLRPIWDSVVADVTAGQNTFWEPLRCALRADNQQLHRRLLHLRDASGLPAEVSALRVFDVIAWREGKSRGL